MKSVWKTRIGLSCVRFVYDETTKPFAPVVVPIKSFDNGIYLLANALNLGYDGAVQLVRDPARGADGSREIGGGPPEAHALDAPHEAIASPNLWADARVSHRRVTSLRSFRKRTYLLELLVYELVFLGAPTVDQLT